MFGIDKRIFFTLILLGLNLFCFSQEYIPKSKGEIIKHRYYALSYSEEYGQAEWVYYVLTPEMLKGEVSRTNNFRQDPNFFLEPTQLFNYKKSEYERGHLVPAADMKIDTLAMNESFYMSNISPQLPSFNRGVWRILENNVRKWAKDGLIHIVAGGVFLYKPKEESTNKTNVPNYYYKIVYNSSKEEMIAFLLPNKKIRKPITEYIVSVDKIEGLTDINFFPQLSDTIETKLESNINLSSWVFPLDNSPKYWVNSQTPLSIQCKGIAKSTGLQCKNKTKNDNGYCFVHQTQSSDYIKKGSIGYIIHYYIYPTLIIVLLSIIVFLIYKKNCK